MDPQDGINSGASRRQAHVLGLAPEAAAAEAEQAHGAPAGQQRRRRRRVDPDDLDPADCEHRHWFRRWIEAKENTGFDRGSIRKSQFQLVAVDASRRVELRWDQLYPVKVFSDKPHIATVTAWGDRYLIHGETAGNASIHAMNGRGLCESKLRVTVCEPRTIPIVFHQVRDLQKPHYKTSESPDKLLAGVNAIFGEQTCLSFQQRTIADPVFDTHPITGKALDFGAQGLDTGGGLAEFFSRALRYPNAVNVFFVWGIKEGNSDGATGGQHVGHCVFLTGKAKTDPARALAHEIGHFLTTDAPRSIYSDDSGHTNHPGKLMDASAKGSWISEEEAAYMYSQGSKLIGV